MRSPPGPEQRDDGSFHVVVVDREDEVPEPFAQSGLLFREQGSRRLRVGRLGGNAHLDALDSARQERKGGVPEAVELRNAIRQGLRESGLALAPGAKHPTLDDRAQSGAPPEIREDAALEHLPELVGHSRHGVDHLRADRTDEPGGGSRHLRDERGPDRDIGLAQVVLRHPAPARLEARADAISDLVAAHERNAHDFGDRLAGDVVLGGSEAAADDHRVAAREREAQARHDALVVVADLGLEVRVDAGERELLAEPG